LDCDWFTTAEEQLLELERFFESADPRAKSVIVWSPDWPRRVVWVGEPPSLPDNWRLRIVSIGAVRGLEIGTIEQPYRRISEVLEKFAVKDRKLCSFGIHMSGRRRSYRGWIANSNEDGVIIHINEIQFDDAVPLARLELDEGGRELERPDGTGQYSNSVPRPIDGEERYYSNLHGSGKEDMLRRVDDCGHNRWDSTNKARKREIRKEPPHLTIAERMGTTRIFRYVCKPKKL
jgi:hypothetical protein